MFKKIITIILVVIVVVGGLFLYFMRPVAAPTTDIISGDNQLTANVIAGESLFRISQERSIARFQIGEILRGEPFTVIGTTNQISGDVIVSASEFKIGTLRINARTFLTDNESRNRAISRFVLKAEEAENEFITFVPNAFEGGGTGPDGQTLLLRITGDLTIAGVTKSVTFDVAIIESEDELAAFAETTIKLADFDLAIPSVPSVASVDEEFVIGAEIVAEKIN